jgi:hypothetical protein
MIYLSFFSFLYIDLQLLTSALKAIDFNNDNNSKGGKSHTYPIEYHLFDSWNFAYKIFDEPELSRTG